MLYGLLNQQSTSIGKAVQGKGEDGKSSFRSGQEENGWQIVLVVRAGGRGNNALVVHISGRGDNVRKGWRWREGPGFGIKATHEH